MVKKAYYFWDNNDLLLELHVQTKAGKSGISGEYNHRLKVAITAAPIDGKANDYLIKFFADYFSVPQRQIKITKGYKSRHKSILILNPKSNLDGFEK